MTDQHSSTGTGSAMSNVLPMPTRDDWARVESINHELAAKVINLMDERDVLVKALEEIASQHIGDEIESENPDFEGGYESIVKLARAALSQVRP